MGPQRECFYRRSSCGIAEIPLVFLSSSRNLTSRNLELNLTRSAVLPSGPRASRGSGSFFPRLAGGQWIAIRSRQYDHGHAIDQVAKTARKRKGSTFVLAPTERRVYRRGRRPSA